MAHTTKVKDKTIRIHEAEYKRLKAIAKKERLTITEALETLLDYAGK